ncbi:MAG TPA: hypothetical protein ENI87_03780 [bacterium]|nr:hypothetical protein [bacterium]
MQNHTSAILAIALATMATTTAAVAQATATVPPAFETLPGNAAVAMPLRWSEGRLQVFIDADLLPPNFVGQTITGLRLRRSVLPGSGSWGAMTRTLEILGGFQPYPAAQMLGTYSQNRPQNPPPVTLFGPSVVNVPATAAPNHATTVGQEFVQITFATPLPVTAGTLFLEFVTSDAPLTIAADQWVDAVWFEDGVDEGLVAVVGDGSCTSRSEPTELRWTSAGGPMAGTTGNLTVTGVGSPMGTGLGAGPVLVWVGVDPENATGGTYLGYGGTFGAFDPLMADCHMWTPLGVAWAGVADNTGRFGTTFDVPGNAVAGQRLGLQAAWIDTTRSAVPLSFSNGLQLVCNSTGTGNHCNSMFFPGTAQSSPWGPQIGLMPVIVLEY